MCARQHPIVESLSQGPAFRDLVILKVNFDTQKEVVRQMQAQMQSTLIVFHGNHERGRWPARQAKSLSTEKNYNRVRQCGLGGI